MEKRTITWECSIGMKDRLKRLSNAMKSVLLSMSYPETLVRTDFWQ